MVIKTTDNLPSTELQDFPFEIPESWVWVRLGDIGNWGAGATPNRHESKYYEKGTIPWLKTGDLNDGIINNIPEYITELALEKTSVKLNPIGTVLIAMYGATIGKLGILNIEATTNQACCACIPYTGIYNKYLFYYLMSQKSEFQSRSEGSGQPNISKEKIIEYIFPLPPLNEQKRIVAKIEELLPYIEQYAEKEEKLTALHQQFPEQLKKSILQAATQGKLTKQDPNDEPALVLIERIKAEKLRLIAEKKLKKPKVVSEIVLRDNLPYEIINGEERCIADEVPFEIPENWCWVRLGNLVELISGQDLAPEQYSKESIGIPYITGASNISNEKLEINRYTNQATKIAKKGDLLITCKGTIGEMIFLDLEKAHIARQIMAIRNHFFVNKYYIFFYLQSYINTLKNAAKSMIPGISRNDLLDILFPLPPFNEQKRIVEKIEKLFSALQNLERN